MLEGQYFVSKTLPGVLTVYVFLAMLCYAMLCYAMLLHVLTVLEILTLQDRMLGGKDF